MNFFECMREVEKQLFDNCFINNIEKIILSVPSENIDIYIEKVDGRLQLNSEDITFYNCAALFLDEEFTISYKFKDPDMTLDEAIEYCENNAENCEGNYARTHKQLAKMLNELKLLRNEHIN